MYIYLITNLINHKRYIGQTTRKIKTRWYCHLTSNCYIGKAIRKYGKENFIIECVDIAQNIQELNQKETYWIKKVGSHWTQGGYNIEWGGNSFIKFSKEAKQKISNTHKNKIVKPETLIKQRQSNSTLPPRGGSGFKGVQLIKHNKTKPWVAFINCEGIRYFLGNYITKEEAAVAYNQKAIELFGPTAFLNKI